MQKPNKIILFVVIAVLIIGGFLLLRGGQTETVVTTPTDTGIVVDETPVVDETTPMGTTTLFISEFMASAPPMVYEESITKAVSYLSETALATLSQTDGQYTSGSLAEFVGVQDIPDLGFSTSVLSIGDNVAEVIVTMQYSSGDIYRLFTLSSIEGIWKIESIEEYTPSVVEEPIIEEVEVEEPIVEEPVVEEPEVEIEE